MKLLHTSDWHLGRSFHGVGTLAAQRRFADQLMETVATENVDVVLLAGDVYDRALPNVDVVNLFDDMLARLNAAGVSGGHHQRQPRFRHPAGLWRARHGTAGVHLRTRIADLATPVLLPLTADADGPAACHLRHPLPGTASGCRGARRGTGQPFHRDRGRRDPHSRRSGHPRRQDSHAVVLAHTFASGGITSASERELAIGGVGAVPAGPLRGLCLRGAGAPARAAETRENVRYSGSPCPIPSPRPSTPRGPGWWRSPRTGWARCPGVDWPPERACPCCAANSRSSCMIRNGPLQRRTTAKSR